MLLNVTHNRIKIYAFYDSGLIVDFFCDVIKKQHSGAVLTVLFEVYFLGSYISKSCTKSHSLHILAMDIFNNLLEILAPSPAPKEIPTNQTIEVGGEISLRSINGQIFNCYVLMPLQQTPGSTLVKCKYLLAVTDTQIVELYPHSNKLGVAVAAEVHDLQALIKLKFKKGDQGILLLEYKSGKMSKILIDDPAACVAHIKTKMTNVGINGSIKNKTERIIENAQSCFLMAKDIETQFSLSPSVEYVTEMMDLLRKATEKFAEINDNSYMEVMEFIKRFLQRSDVSSILDASVKTPVKQPISSVATGITSSTSNTTTELINTPISTHTQEIQIPDNTMTPQQTVPSSSATPLPVQPLPLSAVYDLPDIDAELFSLQNALTYNFEEEEAHTGGIATPATTTPGKYSSSQHSTTGTSKAEPCELTDMLDKMHLEFDTLLHSFQSTIETETTTSATSVEVEDSSNTTNAISNDDTNYRNQAENEGFLEIDFDQTLEEIVNAKK